MKNKYNIQVCWYVYNDQSGRTFRVGHFNDGYTTLTKKSGYPLIKKPKVDSGPVYT